MESNTIQVKSIEEAEQHIQSLTFRIFNLEKLIKDHVQRFDTLQTPWWKRWFIFWFWRGWPIYDLNAEQRSWRPWHVFGLGLG